MLDLFGFFSYACIFYGLYLIGRKEKSGWVVKLIGDAGWVAIGWQLEMASIFAPEACIAMMDVYFIYKWFFDEDSIS